jgi:hypothetical protein
MRVSLEAMYLEAIARTLRSRRFWVWQLGGALIYAIPAAVRLATGSIHLPILSMFMVPWVTPYVPGNIVEKVLVNAFFPGGAGAAAGEIFYANAHEETFIRKQKYLARLGGALLWTAGWSLFQLWGYMQNVTGSYGGNLFESPLVFPLNFLLASLSIFTPDVVGFAKTKLVNACRRLRRKKS